MKLRKVISGGQTGADRTGLECAKELGLETGGIAPRGYRTENGNDTSLINFGLTEHISSQYKGRTLSNVNQADATIWFGKTDSPGALTTFRFCMDLRKPLFINPDNLQEIAEDYEVINVAGNRASKNPAVIDQVRAAFNTLK